MLSNSSAPPPMSPAPADSGSSTSAMATATATPATANLSPEQLIQLCMTTIQAQAQALQNLQNAPASVTTQLPPFTAVSVLSCKSLPDTFPLVEATTLLDIARHEFRPMDLRKLDSKLRDKADDEGTLSTFDSRASSSKDYPSFAALLTPLMLYFRILTQFVVSGGNLNAVAAPTYGLFAYIEHLSSLNHLYEWSAVLQYHMAFHGLRCCDMVNGIYKSWAKSEPELMMQFLWGTSQVFFPAYIGLFIHTKSKKGSC
ncbi:hypothetical protein PM082_009511 [Marasmius tenuissimus]|nr:hypothetical protein PM082_009511 [Marasmius tenuissimus]